MRTAPALHGAGMTHARCANMRTRLRADEIHRKDEPVIAIGSQAFVE
jgi:hypothetical protein